MFALSLGYTDGDNPQYNGNIAAMQWATEDFGANTYNFAYDGANRITAADFSGTGQHNTSYSYDKNGNIMSLTRQGKLGASEFYGMIDNLTYAYNGNQLQSVHDVDDPNHQNNGFTDAGSFLNTEYTYDDNGNLLSDLNKSLSISKYNHLNLPEQLNLNPPQHYYEISYLYSAAGQKLCKATHIDFTPATTTDYVGSFIYQDGQLQSILTGEGRVVVDGSNYEYQYFLKDHLGNTRITFNENKQIIQEDSYYPYGMNMAGLSHESGVDLPNKYLYNGKELQDDFGLDWYDYGARFYDAEIGRWHVVDPMAENYYAWSPYNYTLNNPIRYIDVKGLFAGDPLKTMKIRGNRASNLMGQVRSSYVDGVLAANSKNHQGFDLYAESGTDVLSVADGNVSNVTGDKGDYGRVIEITFTDENGETRVAQYAHLGSTDISTGDDVKEGQVIGTTGTSGNASESSPHLHFELRDSETPGTGLSNRVNPNAILDTKFYSQDSDATQSTTGVRKFVAGKNGGYTWTNQDLDGTEEVIRQHNNIQKIDPREFDPSQGGFY